MEKTLAQPVFNLKTLSFNNEELQALPPYERQRFSMKELVDTFPQSKKIIKELIEEDESLLEENKKLKEEIGNRIWSRLPIHQVDIVTELVYTLARTDFIEHKSNNSNWKQGEYAEDRVERNRKLLSLFSKKTDDSFETKLQRAREYPIENLVQGNRSGFAKCPLSPEKTPSFKIYNKHNRFHCFSCNAHGDSIELYQKLNNCSFKEAVNALCP